MITGLIGATMSVQLMLHNKPDEKLSDFNVDLNVSSAWEICEGAHPHLNKE